MSDVSLPQSAWSRLRLPRKGWWPASLVPLRQFNAPIATELHATGLCTRQSRQFRKPTGDKSALDAAVSCGADACALERAWLQTGHSYSSMPASLGWRVSSRSTRIRDIVPVSRRIGSRARVHRRLRQNGKKRTGGNGQTRDVPARNHGAHSRPRLSRSARVLRFGSMPSRRKNCLAGGFKLLDVSFGLDEKPFKRCPIPQASDRIPIVALAVCRPRACPRRFRWFVVG